MYECPAHVSNGRNDYFNEVSVYVAALSAAASFLTVLSWFIFPDLQSFSRRLLLYLSIADLGQAIYFALPGLSGLPCMIQTAAGVFFQTSSFFWTTCIAYYICKTVQNPSIDHKSELKWYHLISWTYPIIYIIILFSLNAEAACGDREVSRWCQVTRGAPLWRFMSMEIVLVLCWVATAVLYIRAGMRLKKLSQPASRPIIEPRPHSSSSRGSLESDTGDALETESRPFVSTFWRRQTQIEILKEIEMKLVLIPVIFGFLRFWGLLDVVISLFKADFYQHNEWLQWMMDICDPSQGLANFIIFIILTRSYRKRYLHSLKSCICLPIHWVFDYSREYEAEEISMEIVKDSPHSSIHNTEYFSTLNKNFAAYGFEAGYQHNVYEGLLTGSAGGGPAVVYRVAVDQLPSPNGEIKGK